MYRTFLFISFMLFPMAVSGTTILLLKEGGTLEGELLNPNEISRKSYQIKTTGGLGIDLDARFVERVQSRDRQALVEYHTEAPFTENTIKNHLAWARWCSENQLFDQSRLHWRQILELDPDHTGARQVLGYDRTQNGWISRQSSREDRGLIQHRGRWQTAQQIAVESMLETQRNAEDHWRRTIRDLVRRLPNPQAETQLLEIRDPAAIDPLGDAMRNEGNPYRRAILLRSLIRIPDVRAVQIAAAWSAGLAEPSDEIRQMCVEELLRLSNGNPEIRQIMIGVYRSALRAGVEPIVSMAARILGDIGGHEAVPELIDVLVTTRTETYQEQQPAYTFGSGGTGLTQGARTMRVPVQNHNQVALTALIKLTGMNFQFDKVAWQEWYRQSHRSPSVNLRRN